MKYRRKRNCNFGPIGKFLIAGGVLIIFFTTPIKTIAIVAAIILIIIGLTIVLCCK
ncbi:MAG: hypothetical protein K2I60_01175 [Oscillospiraceae bacterium]|nr:hypothetical protein [Oscillospiraceae bacterium]MDE5853094.1 hypothetical protein [Oscillospiraceae bacterium]